MNKKQAILVCLVSGTLMLNSCAGGHSSNSPGSSETQTEKVNAYLLTIDGEKIAYIESAEELEKFKTSLIKDKTEEINKIYQNINGVTLNNKFEITEKECYKNELKRGEEIKNIFLSDGKTFSFSVTVSETESKTVEFKTIYQNSSDYYEGTSVVKNEGKNGERLLVYEVIYIDGVETVRTVISDTEIKAAENKVVLVGTKKSTASTGKYAWPLKSVYVTSHYGERYIFGKYEFHIGVDLRAASGTFIYAADGGKIIFAGYSGSYGYLIKIQHDNGDLTYYAHLSKIDVKTGSRVYKGQYIAKSGTTGNVTGPHLHFEIRKNGKTVNPITYLPKI